MSPLRAPSTPFNNAPRCTARSAARCPPTLAQWPRHSCTPEAVARCRPSPARRPRQPPNQSKERTGGAAIAKDGRAPGPPFRRQRAARRGRRNAALVWQVGAGSPPSVIGGLAHASHCTGAGGDRDSVADLPGCGIDVARRGKSGKAHSMHLRMRRLSTHACLAMSMCMRRPYTCLPACLTICA
eukprot:181893-Chlamydomonas_euryale.AAC.3